DGSFPEGVEGLWGAGLVLRALATFIEKRAKFLPIQVAPDQIAHIFARSAVAACLGLSVHCLAHVIRQGDIHRNHASKLRTSANFSKTTG
ncbi:hypothetical protein, partial [Sulfitobacter sp. UBA4523]|uniref:hypothetical protein n=1 Tax=Sulfitobacter sp. UBA4523 TaxID=1947584 RepID=UPI00257BE05E